MTTAPRRVLVVADTDSYVKWGAALASRMGDGWAAGLLVLRTLAEPSESQLAAAVAGTRFAAPTADVDVSRVLLADLGVLVASIRPDVLVLALRGPVVRVAVREATRGWRPLLVTGLPGIGIPARRRALVFREQTDVLVLQSRREIDDFSALQQRVGTSIQLALATLPFVSGRAPQLTPGPRTIDPSSTVIFATQALVPHGHDDRMRVLASLATLAASRTGDVVIKVRAVAGEAQTHAEDHDFAALLDELRATQSVPTNLVVRAGSMGEHLDAAGALVTVSSTAALEAIDRGLPVHLIGDFGVSNDMINEVFAGSGLIAGRDELEAGIFRIAEPGWLERNHFHTPDADDWLAAIEAGVARLDDDRTAVPPQLHHRRGGALRRAWDRRRVFGELGSIEGRDLLGRLAVVLGHPARLAILSAQRVRRAVVARARGTGSANV